MERQSKRMSCPLNRKRWAGSGYVKTAETSKTATATELEKRMKELCEARESQDVTYFPPDSKSLENVGCSKNLTPYYIS